jgi:transposase
LERKPFAPAGYNPPRSKPLPDFGHVHAELRRRGVTLVLLWEEYRAAHAFGVAEINVARFGRPSSATLRRLMTLPGPLFSLRGRGVRSA